MRKEENALTRFHAINESAIRDIREWNEELKETGMFLQEEEIRGVLVARQDVLNRRGRLQWSISMLSKIIAMTSESKYIEKDQFASAIDMFFETAIYIQNETSDFVSEEDILRAIFLYFDHFCAGDMELLRGSATDRIIKNYRLERDLEVGYDDVIGPLDTFDDREPEEKEETPLAMDDGMSSDIFIARSFVVRAASTPLPDPGSSLLAAQQSKETGMDELLQLLRSELIHYVGGETTSVSELTARNMMQSIQYTLSLSGEGGDTFSRFTRGQQRLKELYSESADLYKQILELGLVIPLDTFYGTVYREVRQFFRLYDPQYAAHECPSLMDYPTAIEVDEAPGILYMHTYLARLLAECRIINRVSEDLREQLLSAYERKYDMIVRSFPVNFFEIMIHQAFASALMLDAIGRDLSSLWLTSSIDENHSSWLMPPEAYEQSLSVLSAMSISERKEFLERVAKAVIVSLGDLSKHDLQYLQEIVDRWIVLFESALMNECPRNMILFSSSLSLPVDAPAFFVEGAQMTDEAYAELLEKLACAPDTAAQASLIRSTVRSGHDLLDLLREDFWLPGEKEAFLATISEEERTILKRMDDENEPVLGKDT